MFQTGFDIIEILKKINKINVPGWGARPWLAAGGQVGPTDDGELGI
jgi:hypothetical protein